MNECLDALKNEIISDYERFQNAGRSWCERNEIQSRMLDEFINGIEIEEGRKYIKVITGALRNQRSVWGFIVKDDNDKKFRKGDILKAAGWAAPARNFARGNVLDGDLECVRWTGAL